MLEDRADPPPPFYQDTRGTIVLDSPFDRNPSNVMNNMSLSKYMKINGKLSDFKTFWVFLHNSIVLNF